MITHLISNDVPGIPHESRRTGQQHRQILSLLRPYHSLAQSILRRFCGGLSPGLGWSEGQPCWTKHIVRPSAARSLKFGDKGRGSVGILFHEKGLGVMTMVR
jgi:hypothetical protein